MVAVGAALYGLPVEPQATAPKAAVDTTITEHPRTAFRRSISKRQSPCGLARDPESVPLPSTGLNSQENDPSELRVNLSQP
jgi:hypothetical protein